MIISKPNAYPRQHQQNAQIDTLDLKHKHSEDNRMATPIPSHRRDRDWGWGGGREAKWSRLTREKDMQMDGRLNPGLLKISPEPWGECFLLLLHSDHVLVVTMECTMFIWEILVNKTANSAHNVHRMDRCIPPFKWCVLSTSRPTVFSCNLGTAHATEP